MAGKARRSGKKKPGGQAAASSVFGKASTAAKAPFDLRKTMLVHMKPFAALRAADTSASRELSRDVYVRAEGAERFWFVGKSVGSAECDGPSAVLVQKRIILEHAKRLQRELAAARTLQLWTAPANTEVAVAQRKQPLTSLSGLRPSVVIPGVTNIIQIVNFAKERPKTPPNSLNSGSRLCSL